MDNEIFEIPPDASRLTDSLKSVGYKFKWAVADIIDNSIDADADKVAVKIDQKENIIIIADNGKGMTKEGLINAMKYGSRNKTDPNQLGKYGLGLKTASTSFCTKLTVISRAKNQFALNSASWDLSHIKEVNKWECRIGDIEQKYTKLAAELIGESSGTIIVCENVKKLEETKKGDVVYGLVDHVGMVFARFLDKNDKRARNIQISVNGVECIPWDPFCSNLTGRQVLAEENPSIPTNGLEASFYIKAVLLPKRELLNENEKRLAKLENKRQGFYIYRENRLIWEGEWLGLFATEYHTSMLRVEISFERLLDEEVNINIGKSEVVLNDSIIKFLRDFLEGPRGKAIAQSREVQNQVKNLENRTEKEIVHNENHFEPGQISKDLEKSYVKDHKDDIEYHEGLVIESKIQAESEQIVISKASINDILNHIVSSLNEPDLGKIKIEIAKIKSKLERILWV